MGSDRRGGSGGSDPPRPQDVGAEDVTQGYELLGVLGEGGMGTVRLARDVVLGRKVAYKELKGRGEVDPAVAARFRDEARITAHLDHPNIVSVYALEVAPDGAMALTMKLVEGQTLGEVIGECRRRCELGEPLPEGLSLSRRLEHFLKVCDAMAFAHGKGVLHRDLKPANIMVGRYNEVYVMDWGVARVMGAPEPAGAPDAAPGPRDAAPARDDDQLAATDLLHHTRQGQILGSPRYMAPEQARGYTDALDGRADLYALGLILQELVCLKPAIPGATLHELLGNAMAGTRRPVEHASRRERVPRELAAVIDRATAPAREERYQSVEALADELRRFLRGEAVRARPDNPAQALARFVGRHKELTLTALLGVLLLCAALAAWALYGQLQAHRREERLNRFHAAVAQRSHRMDAHLQQSEAQLRELAKLAEQAIARGAPAAGPMYESRDFEDPERAPPDLAASPLYGMEVSVGWPGYTLAPGVELDVARPALERLYALRPLLPRLLIDSRPGRDPIAEPAAARRLLLEEGVPIRWAYVGLESGAFFSYPGKGGYPPEYDPRRRPWYALAGDDPWPRWGNPYIDLQGQGLILPCVVALFGEAGERIGVAGVELTFDYIREALLRLDAPGVEEAYLLDGEGRVVVRAGEARSHRELGRLHEAQELEPLPYPAVAAAIARERSGLLERPGPDGRRLFVYYRLPTLGWTYLVEADLAALLR